jgi:prepilin-type N-terminal cleavage/methylation domain-containing protein
MTRRRGFTLIEMIVSFALAALLAVLIWQTYTSGRRQGQQVEEHADLIIASLMLKEYLISDLEKGVGLAALPEGDVNAGTWGPGVVIPTYVAYHVSGRDDAIAYRPATYRWDSGSSSMSRDGKGILRGSDLSDVRFRWTEESPIMLEVEVTGRKTLQRPAAQLTLRLPAPKGTEGFPAWVLASYHRKAALASP